MLTFSTLATRVSWTTDFCKGELKKSQMEQNTAENEAHVSSTMEPLGKMQKKLIRNIKYKVIPSTAYHYCNNMLLYYYHYYYYYYCYYYYYYYYYREFTKYSHTNFTKANKAQQ